jgi:tetratricopeptide (TPR) repeat protein
MEAAHFVFWEALKTIALVFFSLLSLKMIGALPIFGGRLRLAGKGLLYAAVLALALIGARFIGYNTAAEVYFWSAQRNIAHKQLVLAYSNALRAVNLRPAKLEYWETLDQIKMIGGQYASVLQDGPALRTLSGGRLGAPDLLRFATCLYMLGRYNQAIATTRRVIRRDRSYPYAFVLQGMAYIASHNFAAAENTLLASLAMFPTETDAVEQLAQAYFLDGNVPRALTVLDATAHYPFSPQSRRRFEELKALYAQAE